MRPTRMRPETFASWDRGRDQDQLLWDRDQKSGLETTHPCRLHRSTCYSLLLCSRQIHKLQLL